jgi:hypothetical protein
MSDIKLELWEEIFLKTANETDPEKLAQLVPRVELAMFKRELELHDCSQRSEELSTMCVAFEALRVLRRRIARPRAFEASMGDPARFANSVQRSSGTA